MSRLQGTHNLESVVPDQLHNLYGHIVVTLDGSTSAERVLPYVYALAHRFNSAVTLLRAVTPLEAGLMGEAMVQPASRSWMEERGDMSQYDAIGYLRQLQQKVQQQGITAAVDCPEGEHASAIVERARALDADLIVMTTHGRGGIKRAILGSVADEVVRTAHCPVLLVRCDEH